MNYPLVKCNVLNELLFPRILIYLYVQNTELPELNLFKQVKIREKCTVTITRLMGCTMQIDMFLVF